MQDTPDLSRIVNLIMQNPNLISEISALAKGADSTQENAVTTSEKIETAKAEAEETVSAAVPEAAKQPAEKRARRKELLNAMKPYLSDNRRSAIDSMSSILDILEVMMKKDV